MRFKGLPSLLYNSFSTTRNANTGSKISKIVCGFFLIFSLVLSGSLFQGPGLPFARVQEASAQLDFSNPLFANPGSSDFLSYSLAIMPTLPGADLNVSDTTPSKNCDLLVPITYIDGGCMTSLPLLTPITYQPNMTVPVNETVYFTDYNQSSSVMAVSIGLSSDNITAGETQTVTVTVSVNENSTEPISGAVVDSNITDSYGTGVYEYSGYY